MKPAAFAYHAPSTAAEAITLLDRFADDDARILAGGQSLVPMMAFRLARPQHLIDINNVVGFDRLAMRDGHLSIGPAVRHAAFERPVESGVLGKLLAHVVRHIGHAPIRSRGTFCGSLANADPASEWCMTAATLDAVLRVESARGPREIAARDFFAGVMQTGIERDEVLVETRLPLLPEGTMFGFHETCRRAGDFAMAAALVTYRLEDGRIVEPRLGLAGAESCPRRIGAAETMLADERPTAETFRNAANAAAAAIDPLVDSETDGAFRRELVQATVFRALSGSGA